MPFAITTRREVATLEEVSDALWEAVDPIYRTPHVRLQIARVDDFGGTVGPLADGTVIKVHVLNRIDTPKREPTDA